MPPSPGHALGPQGTRLTSSPTAGYEVDTCALHRGEAGAGKAASAQLCQHLAQALSPRLHPQTRLASRHLQRQPRARQAAQLLGSRAQRGAALDCAGMPSMALPGREPGDQGQAKWPAPRSQEPLARHRPDAQMPAHREQRNKFQVLAGQLPGQTEAPPAPCGSTLRAAVASSPPRSGVRNSLQRKDMNTRGLNHFQQVFSV